MRISDWSSDVCSSDLIYHYLRDLGVEELNFLLPDRNLDDAAFRASDKAAEYGRCLSEIFEAWLAEDNEAVHIKFIDQTMVHLRRSVAPGAIFQSPEDRRVGTEWRRTCRSRGAQKHKKKKKR